MFRVAFMVEDKDLALTLHALPQGRLRELIVQPVANVIVQPNGQLAEENPGETTTERIFRALVASKHKSFNGTEARLVCESIGLARSSWQHHSTKMVELGWLTTRGEGKGKVYAIVPGDKS